MKARFVFLLLFSIIFSAVIGWVGATIYYNIPIIYDTNKLDESLNETSTNSIVEETAKTSEIKEKQHQINEENLKRWYDNPPIFMEQPVYELYILLSDERRCKKITDPSDAKKILNNLSELNLSSIPTKETDRGILIVTKQERYPMFITDSTPDDIKELVRTSISSIEMNAQESVDVYQLLAPSQIDRITISAYNSDEGVYENERQLNLDTDNQQTIASLLSILRKMDATGMTLYDRDSSPLDIQDDKGSYYHITIYLGEKYGNTTCEILGYRYAFLIDLSMQNKTRLYSCEYNTTKKFLDAIEKFPEVKVIPNENSSFDELIPIEPPDALIP